MEEPLFNLDELRAISGGDKRFMKEMVDLFITQTEASLHDIEKLRHDKDYPKLFSALHKMKPSVQVLGLKNIYSLIENAEKMKVSGVVPEAIDNQISEIRKLLTAVLESLKKL
jgi:HPt (histidine-containing phosphotransfer) domain-containing protein